MSTPFAPTSDFSSDDNFTWFELIRIDYIGKLPLLIFQ